MKRSMLHAMVLSMLLAASGVGVAQTARLRSAVPHEFRVGAEEFPAGTYEFQRLLGKPSSSDASGMIVIRGIDHPIYRVVLTNLSSAEDPSESKLIFRSVGGQSHLLKLSVAGDSRSQLLPFSDGIVVGEGDETLALLK